MVSPGEAEAQCAILEQLNLTNGTITDDNDVFLFGGYTVYRHFFSPDHHVEKYTMEEIRRRLGVLRAGGRGGGSARCVEGRRRGNLV